MAMATSDNGCVRACIGLGGNVGDAATAIERALVALNAVPGTRLLHRSRLYRTPAWGVIAQADFINAAAVLETALPATELLAALLAIERAQGRDRAAEGARWGPRVLDLDLLLYGELVIADEGLCVSHPYLHERAFVLVPLAEIAPETIVPGRGRVVDLLRQVDARAIVALTPASSRDSENCC